MDVHLGVLLEWHYKCLDKTGFLDFLENMVAAGDLGGRFSSSGASVPKWFVRPFRRSDGTQGGKRSSTSRHHGTTETTANAPASDPEARKAGRVSAPASGREFEEALGHGHGSVPARRDGSDGEGDTGR